MCRAQHAPSGVSLSHEFVYKRLLVPASSGHSELMLLAEAVEQCLGRRPDFVVVECDSTRLAGSLDPLSNWLAGLQSAVIHECTFHIGDTALVYTPALGSIVVKGDVELAQDVLECAQSTFARTSAPPPPIVFSLPSAGVELEINSHSETVSAAARAWMSPIQLIHQAVPLISQVLVNSDADDIVVMIDCSGDGWDGRLEFTNASLDPQALYPSLTTSMPHPLVEYLSTTITVVDVATLFASATPKFGDQLSGLSFPFSTAAKFMRGSSSDPIEAFHQLALHMKSVLLPNTHRTVMEPIEHASVNPHAARKARELILARDDDTRVALGGIELKAAF